MHSGKGPSSQPCTHELTAKKGEKHRAWPMCPWWPQRQLSLHKVLVQDPSLACHLTQVGATDAHWLAGWVWNSFLCLSSQNGPHNLGHLAGKLGPPQRGHALGIFNLKAFHLTGPLHLLRHPPPVGALEPTAQVESRH